MKQSLTPEEARILYGNKRAKPPQGVIIVRSRPLTPDMVREKVEEIQKRLSAETESLCVMRGPKD